MTQLLRSALAGLLLLAGLVPATAAESWLAIAYGEITRGNVTAVHVGVSLGTSKDEAEILARIRCNAQDIRTCGIVRVINQGCGYILSGRHANGHRLMTVGPTEEGVIHHLRQSGAVQLDRPRPMGGCVGSG